jgi:hypothetical protein
MVITLLVQRFKNREYRAAASLALTSNLGIAWMMSGA